VAQFWSLGGIERMHPILTKRIEIPWARLRKAVAIVFVAIAITLVLYVLSAPPIIKAVWKVQIQRTHRAHWPEFYSPLLLGLESDSPIIHGVFKWYFNTVWGCGIMFFDDNPSGKTE
jgi:hypothetical protein